MNSNTSNSSDPKRRFSALIAGTSRWISGLAARERRVLASGGFILGLMLTTHVAIVPALDQFAELNTTLEQERALLDRDEELLREAATYPSRIRTAGGQLLSAAPWVVAVGNPAEGQVALARIVDRAADESGVILTRTEVLPTQNTKSGVATLGQHVEGEGDLESLLSLLADIEGGIPVLRVDELSVLVEERNTSEESAVGGEALRFRFDLVGYLLEGPADADVNRESTE